MAPWRDCDKQPAKGEGGCGGGGGGWSLWNLDSGADPGLWSGGRTLRELKPDPEGSWVGTFNRGQLFLGRSAESRGALF